MPHRLLWRDAECAAMLGIGRSMWRQLHREEMCPEPVRLGLSSIRAWRAREVVDWIDNGCQQRSVWSWTAYRKRELLALQKQIDHLSERVAGG